MPTLLYIHGFLSSPQSHKAVQVKTWLQRHRPDINYLCPALSPYPDEAKQHLLSALAAATAPVGLMGSSLGGFWATWLAEQFDLRAVLINPSVNPMAMFPAYIGKPIQNFHSQECYELRDEHLAQLHEVDTPVIERFSNYWLFAQTGDEVLDYRLAEKKYANCQQTIEQGGDHAFQRFDRHFERAIAFLFD
ncbi:esterase YqiA [Simiduia litorea]|uniref:YqiA/YcfP family alpha/beta fold hydrolase n=1 Tax=Simiduia litorea TaxID=1435348 RepID=UPI0036F21426